MTIKIVLPDAPGVGGKSPRGTRVFTESGKEITGITGLQINFPLDGLITARMEVLVDQIENLEGLVGEVLVIDPDAETGSLEQADDPEA